MKYIQQLEKCSISFYLPLKQFKEIAEDFIYKTIRKRVSVKVDVDTLVDGKLRVMLDFDAKSLNKDDLKILATKRLIPLDVYHNADAMLSEIFPNYYEIDDSYGYEDDGDIYLVINLSYDDYERILNRNC